MAGIARQRRSDCLPSEPLCPPALLPIEDIFIHKHENSQCLSEAAGMDTFITAVADYNFIEKSKAVYDLHERDIGMIAMTVISQTSGPSLSTC